MKGFFLAVIFFLLSSNAFGYCKLGQDGNWHTDEDPFVDAANYDFRLKPGSCPVDHGATISSVKTDFDGTPRPQGKRYDIGAYELIQKPPLESPEEFKVE